MNRRNLVAGVAAFLGVSGSWQRASASLERLGRSIRLVVPFAAGGALDAAAHHRVPTFPTGGIANTGRFLVAASAWTEGLRATFGRHTL
jgi:hypothetical protein